MRLALSQKDAAASLGISVNTFKKHVRPHLKVVIISGMSRFPVPELERWVNQNAV